MPIVEVSQKVGFHSVHRLDRQVEENQAAASRRTHGHDYQAEACVRGCPDRMTGMVVDQVILREDIRNVVAKWEGMVVESIGVLGPPTTENMAVHLWMELIGRHPDLSWVAVGREAHGDRSVYRGE